MLSMCQNVNERDNRRLLIRSNEPIRRDLIRLHILVNRVVKQVVSNQIIVFVSKTEGTSIRV
jgi:hypothetical protein